MTLRRSIIIIMLTVLSLPIHAGKIYKWVDENGATQYTQKPPPKSASTTSEVDIGNHANIMKPEKRGKDYYCGDYRLNSTRGNSRTRGNSAHIISSTQANIVNWRREKERQYEQRLNVSKRMNQRVSRSLDRRIQYNGRGNTSSSYLDSDKKALRQYDRKIAQIDCKIKWAQTKLEEYADEKKAITAKYESSMEMLNELKDRRTAACGEDNREGVIVVDDEYRAYKRCTAQFNRQIKQLKRSTRQAERDYESVQGW